MREQDQDAPRKEPGEPDPQAGEETDKYDTGLSFQAAPTGLGPEATGDDVERFDHSQAEVTSRAAWTPGPDDEVHDQSPARPRGLSTVLLLVLAVLLVALVVYLLL